MKNVLELHTMFLKWLKCFKKRRLIQKLIQKKINLGINKQRLDQNITRQIKATQTFSLSAQRQNTA